MTHSLSHAPDQVRLHAPACRSAYRLPLGGCAGDARHLLANVCIPGASRACHLAPVALITARLPGMLGRAGAGGGELLHVCCGERPEEALQWATTRWLWGPWGLWLLGPWPGRACAGPGWGGGVRWTWIRGTWWSPVLHGCARLPPTPCPSL